MDAGERQCADEDSEHDPAGAGAARRGGKRHDRPGRPRRQAAEIDQLADAIKQEANTQCDKKLLNTLSDISQHLRGGTAADANALRTTDLANLDTNIDGLSTLQASANVIQSSLLDFLK